MPIRILIVDDHRILRAGLKTLLAADANLEVVGEATNAAEALELAQTLRPDIVLMDIGMPGMDALEATRRLAQSAPGRRVLILSMHEDSALVQEYIRAGASGYIIKRAAESELVDAIYAVWRGIIYIHPALIPSLVSPPPRSALKAAGDKTTPLLTAREVEVLRLIVRGFTNQQVAKELNISIRTVETHRANVMDKLNLHSRVELMRYAAEHGLVRMDDLDD